MTILTPTVRDAICRSDFHAFAVKCFEVLNPGASVELNWHLEAISHCLTGVMKGEVKRLIINAPPRSLKSHFTSVSFPAFVLGHYPTQKFICASYSQDLSSKLSSDCRRLMESNFYARLFAKLSLTKSTESEIQTSDGGFRFATSVGGTLTGRGADILIVDDPLNATEAFSDVNRKRVNEWFSRSLVSRLDNKQDGAIVVIAQRLHPEDLPGYLIDRGGWEILNLPAIAPCDLVVPVGRATYRWKIGEPLQSSREPLRVLDHLKSELGTTMFNAQYLQEPVPESGNMLKREWLRQYQQVPMRQSGDKIVQSWDTALKATDTSNYSACLTFLVRNDNEYYLIDVLREKLEFPDLRRRLREHAVGFRVDAVLVEDQASGTSLIQYAKQDRVQGVIGIKPDADKKTRMNCQTPKLEAKSLIVPRSAPWLPDFLLEYLAFPAGRNDDQIDALSQFLTWQSGRKRSVFTWDMGYEDGPGLQPPPPEWFSRG